MYIFSHELYVNINRSTNTHNFISLAFSEHLMKIQSQEKICLVLILCFAGKFSKTFDID